MNIDHFKDDEMSSHIEGLRATLHKIACRLSYIDAIQCVAIEDHPVCIIYQKRKWARLIPDRFGWYFATSNWYRSIGYKKIFSAELCFDGENEFVETIIWTTYFFRRYEYVFEQELEMYKCITGIFAFRKCYSFFSDILE